MNQLRNFEISIWTLQDDFITIIESAWIKSKGKTQNASMTLNIDGTQQLTFSVPMYYYDNGEMVINPVWTSFTGDKVLLNTRKVKVILNKQTDNEEIYEFVIDKITERHDNDEFYCDVECSGLAFYELGKIGYKVSLSEEDFYNDDYKWFTKEEDSEGNILVPEQPVANIQYWLNKFLMPYPLDESVSAATWYYKIQMNWDLTAEGKAADKVYENDIYGDTYLLNQEKYRMINLEESNFYNLTQNIAETFGVYCKYIYSYDENYHIIGRTIVFYNNFLNEENLSINYRGNTQSVSRELDTTDLVTKMFVRTVDNNGDTTSIIDVEENDSGEDYLLNFDYLYSIGSVDEESYNKIDSHKAILKVINTELKSVTDVITNIENALPELYARRSIAEDSIQIDKEKINTSDKLLKSITGGSDWIKITKNNPDTAVLLKESEANYYYIKLTKQGIDPNSVVIYNKMLSFDSKTKSYNFSENNKIKTAIPVYDDANNLIRMTNIYYDEGNSQRSKIVYLTYRYKPTLYYENVIKAWQKKLAKDELELNEVDNLIKEYETELKDKKEIQKQKIDDKNSEINSFERMMGPAIREGYWQPEDYSEHVETFSTSYKLNKGQNNSEPYKTIGGTPYDSFFWDEKLFDGEQDIKYQIGIEQNVVYYPCIDLTLIWNSLKANLNSFSFIFYDTAVKDASGETQGEIDDPLSLRVLSLGSGAQIAFIKGKRGSNNAETIFPVLILIGLQNDIPATISAAKQNGFIGIINYVNNSNNPYTIESRIEVANRWLTLSNSYKVVYPRIRIESTSLKTDTNSLIIRDNENILNQYVDYYINNRTQESFHLKDSPIVDSHYITIKPAVIFKSENWSGNNEWTQLTGHKIEVLFRIANCAISIYRDAKEILKDSSKPKVSYNVTIDILNNNIISRPSYFLSKIIKINDYDLLLDNAWGYVSGVTLDLDHPENDNIEIQNYTNKFEDLFTTIVAQTEAMKKTSYIVDTISNSFTSDGYLTENTLKNSLSKVDLNYAFNNGNLTIDEVNGIWGISDSGVVAFRGGGIFTATERDKRNNWIWNTGVTPEGINADLITAGQLDTNKIRVFAGDRERFQLNADGLFAYKSFLSDFDFFADNPRTKIYGPTNNPSSKENDINNDSTLDPAQFVRFDENGLFLIAKEGAYVLNKDKTDYIVMTKYIDPEETISRFDSDNELKRVSISWDGLTLKNYEGDNVFYADSVSGDLYLKGSVFADAFYVINEGNVTQKIATYITDTSMHELKNQLEENRNVGLRVKDYISSITGMISGKHLQTKETVPKTFTGNVIGNTPPIGSQYSDGDYYYANDGRIFVYVVEKKEDGTETKNWDLITTLSNDEKASMTVDAINGNIRLFSNKIIDILAANENDSSILSIKPEGITMGTSKKINITSGAEINIDTDGKFSAIGGEALIATSKDWESADASNFIWMHYDETLKKEVLEIATDDLKIKSGGNFIVGAGGNVQIGAGGSITLLSSNSSSGGESGISLSGEGIIIGTNASLNIQAGSLMITGTNVSSGKNIGKYVSDEISDKTKNSIIGVDVEYNSNKDPKNPPSENDSNWSTTAPEWDGEKYIWQRTVTTINELDESGQNKKVYSAPTCISGANGKTGLDGYNQATLYLYKRSTERPTRPQFKDGTFTYFFETGALTSNFDFESQGWYIQIPEGDNPCWFISTSVMSRDNEITFSYTKWSTEGTKLVENGKNGIGINGLNTATVYLYQRSEEEPKTKPSNIKYTFSDASCTGTFNGWSTEIKAGTNPCWIIAAKAVSRDDSYTFSNDNDWAGPIKLVENGAKGNNGLNQATIYLYQRASDVNKPTTPTTSATYTFANGNLTSIPEGWVRDIPTGTDPCWVISGIAISNGDTDDIEEWTQPEKLVENGINGANTATVYLYRRGNTQPTSANGMMPNKKITYNFSQRKITTSDSNLNGWKTIIPADDGTPCWVISAVASSNTSADTIAITEWGTEAIKFVESGTNGLNRATVYLYQWGTSSTPTPNKPSGILIYHFENGTITANNNNAFNGWTTSIPPKPNENYPCYITSVAIIAAANETTYDIEADDWAAPVEFIKYGADGTSVKILGSYETEAALKEAHPTGFEGDAYIVGKNLYVWVQNEGEWKNVGQIQGDKGEQGQQGPAGTSRYIFIRYAETDLTGESSGTLYPTPTDKTMYIGIVNRTTNSAPTNPSAYTWSRYVGLNKTVITLYKRSASAPATIDKPASFNYSFSNGIEEGADYLNGWSPSIPTDDGNPCWAITATALSPSDTDTIEDTEWTENPVKIVQSGTNAVVYNLTCNPNVIVDNGSAFSPTSFTVSATSINGNATPEAYAGRFIIKAGNTTLDTNSKNQSSYTYTPTYNNNITSYTVTLYKAGGTTTVLDTQTIPVIKEGKNGTDSYTVMLSNESHTFAGGVSAAIASTVTSNIIAYKGATQVAVTIGTITGAPTGMTVTSVGSGGTNARITVAVTTSLETKQGVINIPVTVDGKNFTLHFSWALALAGNSVSSIKEQYAKVSGSAQPTASTEWDYECPTWDSSSTIWTRSEIKWENGTTTYTDPPVKAEGINSANANAATAKQDASEAKEAAEEALKTSKVSAIAQFNYVRSGSSGINDNNWADFENNTQLSAWYRISGCWGRIKFSNGLVNNFSMSEKIETSNDFGYTVYLEYKYGKNYNEYNPPENEDSGWYEYNENIFESYKNYNIWLRISLLAISTKDGTRQTIRTGPFLVNNAKFTQKETFNMLTNGGKIDGIYMNKNDSNDTELYINATFIKSGNLELGGTDRNPDGQLIIYKGSAVVGSWNTNKFLIGKEGANDEPYFKYSIQNNKGELTWKTGNTEMNKDGTLIIKKAVINGAWSSVYNPEGGENGTGLLLGRGQIIGLENGKNLFNILMPYAYDTNMIIDSYIDSNGNNIIAENVEPESKPSRGFNFDTGGTVEEILDSLFPQNRKIVIMTNKNSNSGIGIGTNNNIMLSFSNSGSSIFLDAANLYVGQGDDTMVYKAVPEASFIVGNRTFYIRNGIIVQDI